MKSIQYLFAILGLLIFSYSISQVPEPGAPQTRPVALMNGTAHLGNGEVINNSVVAFENGKLTIVTDATKSKIDLTNFDVINVFGKHVYPGLILPNSVVGLEDISAVRATLDFEEVGDLSPNVRSIISYNTDSEIIPTLRFNGILLAQVVPAGELIAGSSSVMMMDGWNWEDAAYKVDEGVHVYWPSIMLSPNRWRNETNEKPNDEYDKTLDVLESFLKDAKAYGGQKKPDKINLKFEAMRSVFKGDANLYIHADKVKEIIDGVTLVKKMGIPKIVIIGASDGWYARKFLKENNIPVLLAEVHRLPNRPEEDVDMPYKLPFLLSNEGILVGLTYRSELQSSRNLPFFAGTAAAYGLDKEEALKLVTSNTAKVLGIADRTGTLEAGKDANIVVSEGDLLDMRTNQVYQAYIQGRKVNLEGKQQVLYDRYRRKYEKNR